MIFNEIKCYVNTFLGLVGGASPASPPVFAPGQSTAREPNGYRRRRKIPKMSQILSSMQYIFFRKTSASNIGAPNLLLAPCAI